MSSQPGKSENEAPAPTHGSTTWSRGELAAVPVRMLIAGAFDACLLSGALQKQPIGLQGVGSKCGEAWWPVNRLLLEKPNMLRRPGRRRHCEVCGHRGFGGDLVAMFHCKFNVYTIAVATCADPRSCATSSKALTCPSAPRLPDSASLRGSARESSIASLSALRLLPADGRPVAGCC